MCGCGDGQEGPISYTARNPHLSRFLLKGNLGLKRIEPEHIIFWYNFQVTKLSSMNTLKSSCILNFWYN